MKNKEVVVVDDVKTKSGNLEPLIVTFEHASVNLEEVEDFQVGVYEHKSDSQKDKPRRLIAAQTPHLTYVGVSHSPTSLNADSYCHTVLGIRNKRTNKMRLVEVSMVQLSPSTQGLEAGTPKPEDTPQEKSFRERHRDLTKSFGSAVKRRKLEAKEKVEVAAGDGVNTKMEQIGREATISVEETVLKGTDVLDEAVAELLPPCNRDTVDPQAVYKMEDILGPDMEALLEDSCDGVIEATDAEIKQWEEKKRYSKFFFTCLQSVKRMVIHDRQRLMAKGLIYMECLIKIVTVKHYEMKKIRSLIPDEFPRQLREKLLNEFTVQATATNSRTRSNALQDKAFCYILALGLLLNNLKVDLQDLTSTLHLRVQKVVQLFRLIGATSSVDVAAQKHFAILKMPLTSLPSKMSRGPGKRKSRT